MQNFAKLIEAPVYLRALWNTVIISGSVTLLCVLLGYPIAYTMAHAGARLRRLLIFVVLIPFWSSILVRTFAWMVLLQKRGLINKTLVDYLGLIETPLTLIYNRTGVLIGMSHVLLPFMILPLYAVLSRIDPSLTQRGGEPGRAPGAQFPARLPAAQPAGPASGSLLVFVMGARLLHHAGAARRAGRHHDRAVDRDAGRRLRQLGLGRRTGGDSARRHRNRLHVRQPLADRGRAMMRTRADHVWPWLRAALCAAIVVFLIAPMVIVVIVSFSSAHFLTFPPPGLLAAVVPQAVQPRRPGSIPCRPA